MEAELTSKENIITDYKQITKQLSDKLERKEQAGSKQRADKGGDQGDRVEDEQKDPLVMAQERIQVIS